MTAMISLKELEKKAWQMNFQDGITDITIGLILVISTICQMYNDIRFNLYPLFIIPVLFSVFAKRTITAPRIGLVNYSKERNRKRFLLSLVITTSLVLLLLLTVSGFVNLKLPATPILIGVIIFIICNVIAFVLNFNRMYIYGILITFSFSLSEISIYKTGIISSGAFAWLISGVIIIGTGIYYLFGFIKKYPKPINGAIDGE